MPRRDRKQLRWMEFGSELAASAWGALGLAPRRWHRVTPHVSLSLKILDIAFSRHLDYLNRMKRGRTTRLRRADSSSEGFQGGR
jgi:hypothetical protein